jgi:hypothetical protein
MALMHLHVPWAFVLFSPPLSASPDNNELWLNSILLKTNSYSGNKNFRLSLFSVLFSSMLLSNTNESLGNIMLHNVTTTTLVTV